MTQLQLNEDQRDALQEVTNIAMGQAASKLAELLNSFVEISIPRIKQPPPNEVGQAVTEMVGAGTLVSAVRQSFMGEMQGEALIIYGQEGCNDLADLMGYESDIDPGSEMELLLDIGNILIGACLNGIAEVLHSSLSFTAPSLLAHKALVDNLIKPEHLALKNALLIEVNYRLHQRNFYCHMVALMPDEAIERLQVSVDHFLESF